jgi:hypothetical protein
MSLILMILTDLMALLLDRDLEDYKLGVVCSSTKGIKLLVQQYIHADHRFELLIP